MQVISVKGGERLYANNSFRVVSRDENQMILRTLTKPMITVEIKVVGKHILHDDQLTGPPLVNVYETSLEFSSGPFMSYTAYFYDLGTIILLIRI